MAQKLNDVRGYANLARYEADNKQLGKPEKGKPRVVFMGNSITEGWVHFSPDFFTKNGYVGRGIGGQVSHQMLLRFRNDVIDLEPEAVVILAGTNDLARNSGFVPMKDIVANVKSMADLARAHGIKVLICSVLPAKDFPWNPGLDAAKNIIELNKLLKGFAETSGHTFVDYYSALVDGEGGLKVPDYTTADDLVHPNKAGYEVMEPIVQKAIQAVLKKE